MSWLQGQYSRTLPQSSVHTERSISITQKLVRYAESQAPPQFCWVRVFTLSNSTGYLHAHSCLRSLVLKHQMILLLLSIRDHINIRSKPRSLRTFKGLNYLKVGKCFYYTTLTTHFILTFQNGKFFTFYCPNLIPVINIIS